jgi:hypothetical protein
LLPPNVLHPMERAGYLINKLKEQYHQQEPATHLLLTLDLLRKELMSQLRADPVNVSLPPELASLKPLVAAKSVDDPLYDLDLTRDIPTFAHQNFCPIPSGEDMTEKMASDAASSFQSEITSANEDVLSSHSPIKDLKRAISARNRFLFVHELFRGDEAMFERSIKTIQGFSIFPEARFWIERELKTKLGWQENTELVRLFDHLVKRRFS